MSPIALADMTVGRLFDILNFAMLDGLSPDALVQVSIPKPGEVRIDQSGITFGVTTVHNELNIDPDAYTIENAEDRSKLVLTVKQ